MQILNKVKRLLLYVLLRYANEEYRSGFRLSKRKVLITRVSTIGGMKSNIEFLPNKVTLYLGGKSDNMQHSFFQSDHLNS